MASPQGSVTYSRRPPLLLSPHRSRKGAFSTFVFKSNSSFVSSQPNTPATAVPTDAPVVGRSDAGATWSPYRLRRGTAGHRGAGNHAARNRQRPERDPGDPRKAMYSAEPRLKMLPRVGKCAEGNWWPFSEAPQGFVQCRETHPGIQDKDACRWLGELRKDIRDGGRFGGRRASGSREERIGQLGMLCTAD
ncbi:uncharacterized protein BDZ99DRAFT_481401 [Mytilinidion resinicola]|uniref:Uncharacterized protein n=1 Tax=Mytilinidion resinicola TaxID=574789 RepID=A0A6A6Y605_9PEZI|nr:uncharacterized protein BDZ99DRAFT_481401 [Mytilinidion resinicola]KAF2804246.1 hypothetical protein BDZ99DRAFT_481401 [Mytilinidion resinicola]